MLAANIRHCARGAVNRVGGGGLRVPAIQSPMGATLKSIAYGQGGQLPALPVAPIETPAIISRARANGNVAQRRGELAFFGGLKGWKAIFFGHRFDNICSSDFTHGPIP